MPSPCRGVVFPLHTTKPPPFGTYIQHVMNPWPCPFVDWAGKMITVAVQVGEAMVNAWASHCYHTFFSSDFCKCYPRYEYGIASSRLRRKNGSTFQTPWGKWTQGGDHVHDLCNPSAGKALHEVGNRKEIPVLADVKRECIVSAGAGAHFLFLAKPQQHVCVCV